MKGLLRKDWYMTVKYLWYMWGMAIVFSVFLAMISRDNEESPLLAMLYPCIMIPMMSPALLANDDREKWESYAQTLPITRAQCVTEKYCYGLCTAAVSSALGAVIAWIIRAELSIALLCAAVCLFVDALILPFIFWLGGNRGYFVSLIPLGALGALFGFGIGREWDVFARLREWNILLTLLAALALYALSWRLSVALYQKREL